MVEELDADTLAALVSGGADVQIVDVRRPEAFASGHIPDAENIPFERLLRSIDSVHWGEQVVFVCPYGERSRQAAELLSAFEGVDEATAIYNLSEGLMAWNGPFVAADRR